MEFWDNIVNTALIGTDKKKVGANEMSQHLENEFNLIESNSLIDTEEKFLQLAALGSNYRASGLMPLQKSDAILKPAPAEVKSYCSEKQLFVLNEILADDYRSLLNWWLKHCDKNNLVVTPEYVTR